MQSIVAKPQMDHITEFLSHCKIQSYGKKSIIFKEGDAANTLYYILNGSVGVTLEDENEQEIVIAYLNKGEFIGEMNLFDFNESRSATVIAREETTLAKISYAEFSDYSISHPKITALVTQQMAKRLRNATKKIADLSFLDATGRIVSALLDLSKDPSSISHLGGMQLTITRQELGKLTNCSREMVGRVLKDIEKQGLIEVSGKTVIVYGTR